MKILSGLVGNQSNSVISTSQQHLIWIFDDLKLILRSFIKFEVVLDRESGIILVLLGSTGELLSVLPLQYCVYLSTPGGLLKLH